MQSKQRTKKNEIGVLGYCDLDAWKALTASEVTKALGTWLVGQHNGPDVGHETHLTLYWGCSIKADHVEDYSPKGEHACNGVDL